MGIEVWVMLPKSTVILPYWGILHPGCSDRHEIKNQSIYLSIIYKCTYILGHTNSSQGLLLVNGINHNSTGGTTCGTRYQTQAFPMPKPLHYPRFSLAQKVRFKNIYSSTFCVCQGSKPGLHLWVKLSTIHEAGATVPILLST